MGEGITVNERSPNKKTVIKVISWLEHHGLSIYGPCVDIETGQEFPSLMDYNADSAIKYIKLLRKDKIWRDVT